MTALEKERLDSQKIINVTVTREDIAAVVERLTGIKVQGVMENERDRLLHLEELLHQNCWSRSSRTKGISGHHSLSCWHSKS